MAVSVRRFGFTLWVAWLGAVVLGMVIAELLGPQIVMPYGQFGVVALWAPLALLQFFVLRAIAHVAPGAAGLWVVATIVAMLLSGPANLVWFEGVLPRLSPSGLMDMSWTMDAFFDAAFYFFPLLLGVAQGVVLARILARKAALLIWVGANLAAWALARSAMFIAIAAFRVDLGNLPPGPTWPDVLLAVVFGAATGAALVVLIRGRLDPAPAPAGA
jgi:hypothetical protein